MRFRAGRYLDPDTGRFRWAVLDPTSCVWYFPKRYGKTEAQRLAARLNKEIK